MNTNDLVFEKPYPEAHVNSVRLGPYYWVGTVEERQAQDWLQVGNLESSTTVPYIYKLSKIEIEPNGIDRVRVMEWVEPASITECQKYWQRMELYDFDPDLAGDERRASIEFAARAASELLQESWIKGVSPTATIFCGAHQSERDAHGANHYEDHLLCHECVVDVEKMMAGYYDQLQEEGEDLSAYSSNGGRSFDLEKWVEVQKRNNAIRSFISKLEADGRAYYKLPDGRWAEIHCLYRLNRGVYREEPQSHWPNADIEPAMYEVLVRSAEWSPDSGEPNIPELEFVLSSQHRLFEYLESGGKWTPDLRTVEQLVEDTGIPSGTWRVVLNKEFVPFRATKQGKVWLIPTTPELERWVDVQQNTKHKGRGRPSTNEISVSIPIEVFTILQEIRPIRRSKAIANVALRLTKEAVISREGTLNRSGRYVSISLDVSPKVSEYADMIGVELKTLVKHACIRAAHEIS